MKYSLTHDQWRRMAASLRKARALYIMDVQVTPELNAELRRILGVGDLCLALGGPVEVVSGLDTPLVQAVHLDRRIDKETGRSHFSKRRHDGKVENPPSLLEGVRVVA